ncbi:hypothetical protein TSUD_395720 [Trifolium subterraneum]|uniref:Reverse transcriptase zinc-binding domain-containing protein n=1 Tax=Trifolium subterraneum TaxID=3900 RepID=A0A2Z6MZ64_TRISU|nr:hypothetical protein TSUD_395720 [Trifolium subterraneum]
MPVKVWKLIVGLQRRFLWGGSSSKKKISWVSWSNICKPKKDGGLDIKDLRLVNNALLAKWRWRILTEGQGLWRDILLARYESLFPAPHFAGRPNGFRGVSLWWSDVSLLGTRVNSHSDWFSEGASDQCLDRVVDMGNWAMGDWEWEFRWKTSLDLLDQDLLSDLIESLRQVNLSSTEDQWCWRHEIGGSFSIKSAYLVLEDKARLQRPLPRIDFINLARDRIPTRQNLHRRRVLVGATDSSCVFCGAVEESVDHIFVSCDRISSVWYRVSRWLGVEYVSPNSIMQVFESFFGLGVGCRVRLGFILVWHAVVWTIWTSQNDIIFAGGYSVVDRVKLSSWKWILGKNPDSPCSL